MIKFMVNLCENHIHEFTHTLGFAASYLKNFHEMNAEQQYEGVLPYRG